MCVESKTDLGRVRLFFLFSVGHPGPTRTVPLRPRPESIRRRRVPAFQPLPRSNEANLTPETRCVKRATIFDVSPPLLLTEM